MSEDRGAAPVRQRIAALVESRIFQNVVIGLIVVNAIILGLQTSATVTARLGGLLELLDRAILAVFVTELALRIAAHGPRFFRDPWSLFDLAVVGIALLPASGPFAVLRAFRVLRVLRLLSVVPSMRRVIGGLLAAVPGLSSIIAILAIVFYVAAVMATRLYGESFPELFGTLGASLFTLFQVMTLEGWAAEIVRPVMEVYPWAWVFFLLYLLISTFTVLNLFIAVIVNAMQREHEAEEDSREEAAADQRQQIAEELHSLRSEIAELKRMLAGRDSQA